MFRVMLWSQWKWSRLVVVLGTLAAFGLPLASVGMATPGSSHEAAMRAPDILRQVQSWGTLYPVLAAGLGLLLAMSAWAPDHRGRHVHALTLPVPRWRYVLLRYGSGIALLLLPALALLVGALVAGSTATLPLGLQAYPLALALRFALALVTAFSVFFAISGGTARTAGMIIGVLVLLVLLDLAAGATGLEVRLGARLLALLLDSTGPFAVFSGRWMLIDV